MNLEPVALHQLNVLRAARHRSGVVVLKATAGDQDQRELLVGDLAWLAVRQRIELAQAVVVDERFGVKNLCIAAVGLNRPAEAIAAEALVSDSGEDGCQRGDLFHRIFRRRKVHLVAERR